MSPGFSRYIKQNLETESHLIYISLVVTSSEKNIPTPSKAYCDTRCGAVLLCPRPPQISHTGHVDRILSGAPLVAGFSLVNSELLMRNAERQDYRIPSRWQQSGAMLLQVSTNFSAKLVGLQQNKSYLDVSP